MSEMDEFDARLAELVSGELDPESDEARRFFAQGRVSREEFEALRALASELDAAAAYRAGSAQSAAQLAAQDARTIADQIEALAGADASAGRSRNARRGLLVAAALLLLVPLTFQLVRRGGSDALEPEPGRGPLLGGSDGVRIEVPDELEGRLRWSVPAPLPSDSFRVIAREGGPEGDRLHEELVEGRTWWSPPAGFESLPRTTYFEVRQLDPGGGRDLGSGWVLYSRP